MADSVIDLQTRLAEIRARLDAATPGKWEWSGDDLIQRECGESVLDIWPRMDEGKLEIGLDITPYDRDLIAHATADLRYLLRVVEGMQKLREWTEVESEKWRWAGEPAAVVALDSASEFIDRIAKEAGDE